MTLTPAVNDRNCMTLKRSGKFFALVFIIGAFLCTTGCSHHITNEITGRMIPDDIYNDYKVQPKDLLPDSKCSTPPSVKIVNTENRTEDFEFFSRGVHSFFVNPHEIMESSVSYLKVGYGKSGIKADDNSTNIIEMKLSGIEVLPGMWQIGSKVRFEVNIPGAKLSKVFEASEYGQVLFTTFADSIHLITRQIIDDQAIQNYILCR
jgi:hypothetical protein